MGVISRKLCFEFLKSKREGTMYSRKPGVKVSQVEGKAIASRQVNSSRKHLLGLCRKHVSINNGGSSFVRAGRCRDKRSDSRITCGLAPR